MSIFLKFLSDCNDRYNIIYLQISKSNETLQTNNNYYEACVYLEKKTNLRCLEIFKVENILPIKCLTKKQGFGMQEFWKKV